jgi:hypothetical protein
LLPCGNSRVVPDFLSRTAEGHAWMYPSMLDSSQGGYFR